MKSWEKGFFMNQKDLIYIKTIVDEGGITQAAKKLFVSQPSLSQSVKRIEDALGVLLFKRTPKGLTLTPEGEEYYRMANKVLNIYDTFEDEIHNIQELRSGTVTVGATTHRGIVILPEFLADFHVKFPGIKVKLVEAGTDELEKLLLDGKLDFAMLREPPVPTAFSEKFEYHGLSKEEFMILLPEGHPAGQKAEWEKGNPIPTLDPKWLAEEEFLLPEPSMRLYESVRKILRMAGIEKPKQAYSSPYLETLVHLTAAGAGVSIVTYTQIKSSKCAKKYDYYRLPASYGVFWGVSLATLKDAYISKAARKFIEEYNLYLGV